jgi:hypothetical protein
VLVASGLGFPITQAVIARFGSRGAIVAEGVVVGLLVRDAALVATGTPRRLQRWPAMLLWLELIAVAGATITGVAAVARPGQVVDGTPAGRVEAVRRFLVGLLFGLHTYRFQVYLRPDRGLAGALGTGAPPEALRRR